MSNIDHDWFFHNITCDPEKDGHTRPIVDIPYCLKSTKDDQTVETHGRAYLDTSNITNFINTEDLTVDIVRGWLDAKIDMASIESNHEEQLNA